MTERIVISREEYRALGQTVASKHPRTPGDYQFEVTHTQQIQLGKGVTVNAGDKAYSEGIYAVKDGDWY